MKKLPKERQFDYNDASRRTSAIAMTLVVSSRRNKSHMNKALSEIHQIFWICINMLTFQYERGVAYIYFYSPIRLPIRNKNIDTNHFAQKKYTGVIDIRACH